MAPQGCGYDAEPSVPRLPMTGSLHVDASIPVARLRLQRPSLHNAFDAGLIAELTDALHRLGRTTACAWWCRGRRPTFSAGADLTGCVHGRGADEATNRDDALALAHLMRTLDELPKPTIARVHGAAFGGGVGLIACCDIAIGVPEAKFGLTESRLGLLPAVISPYVIAAIGARQARRWFATAETFDARPRCEWAVATDRADAELDVPCSADRCAAKAGQSRDRAKVLVRDVTAAADRDALDTANAALIARLRVSREGQEGIGAFLDKRSPTWVGKE